ncbi:hypothetical protein [Nocardioides pyridinolyticus]
MPFSAEVKYMATAHRRVGGVVLVVAKGAPDMLLSRCGHALVGAPW